MKRDERTELEHLKRHACVEGAYKPRSGWRGAAFPCTGTSWFILSRIMSTDDAETKKDEAWANLCRAEGWVCRVCGSVPGRGKRFPDNLCEDCLKMVRNE